MTRDFRLIRSLATGTLVLLAAGQGTAQTPVTLRPGPSVLRESVTRPPLRSGLITERTDTSVRPAPPPTYWLEGALIGGTIAALGLTAFALGECNDSGPGEIAENGPCWDNVPLAVGLGFGAGDSLGALIGSLLQKPDASPTIEPVISPDTTPRVGESSVEIPDSVRRRVGYRHWEGAAIGGGAGALTGLLLALGARTSCSDCESHNARIAETSVAGAGLVGAFGFLVGLASPKYEWVPIVSDSSIQLRQHRSNFGAGVKAGVSSYNLEQTGTAFIVGPLGYARFGRHFLVEVSVPLFDHTREVEFFPGFTASERTRFLLPELSAQAQVYIGRFRPYLAAGGGVAIRMNGPMDGGATLHAAAGTRVLVGKRTFLRGEVLARSIRPWAGESVDVTVGMEWASPH